MTAEELNVEIASLSFGTTEGVIGLNKVLDGSRKFLSSSLMVFASSTPIESSTSSTFSVV